MSDKYTGYILAFWLVSFAIVAWSFDHPTFTWNPKEVARDRIITR